MQSMDLVCRRLAMPQTQSLNGPTKLKSTTELPGTTHHTSRISTSPAIPAMRWGLQLTMHCGEVSRLLRSFRETRISARGTSQSTVLSLSDNSPLSTGAGDYGGKAGSPRSVNDLRLSNIVKRLDGL